MPAGQYPAGYGQFPTGQPAGFAGQMPAGFQGQMPEAYGQHPAGYGQMPEAYTQYPTGYGQMPMNYGQMPGFTQGPANVGTMPAGMPMQGTYPMGSDFGQSMQNVPGTANPQMGNPYGTGAPYGATPYGYPQMAGAPTAFPTVESETPMMMPAGVTQPQSLPVGTGALEDCGCGTTSQAPAPQPINFVPPTPPIYSAPFTAGPNVAQPPFLNPYGMGPIGTDAFGDSDESS
jgi:morphogenetic protein associated with SpoVID